ncbi:class I SAM-dependent methyltransferase [Leptolyngbya sp. 7M]|uniref:class I SAM-dependent methyltransferase n=1 Tax=Leptolyngbya sp. 7M TaxID=2812896 RepID=UPI001B8B3D6D|nr:class I SAM-dependent methyltransferase [Leptolyngbya sp. 7M]QYO68137.1 class I SAM-dependent methyltransferase [Leptolyngbya sp. 7M]
MYTQSTEPLTQYITPQAKACSYFDNNILAFPISRNTFSLKANRYYFGHPKWSRNYLAACHQNSTFKERWKTAIDSWQDQIVVDIGCGPGNIYRALRDHLGKPRLLIGIDISPGGLQIAQELGYTPILADAHHLPFVDGFADVVTLNAALHHCDDMDQVLREAARLVKPRGLLVTDHDPQRTAWKDGPFARWIWNARLPLYRWTKRGGHATIEEQYWSTATEVHHKPGDGVTTDFFHRNLDPLGFAVKCYPHSGGGTEVLQGNYGRPQPKMQLVQWLTGIDSSLPEAALLLMCVARKQIVYQQDEAST